MKKNHTPQNGTSASSNARGLELADRGWLEEAIREFSRAIDLDQNAAMPLVNRASVLMEQGRLIEALEDLLKAVRVAPNEPATHYHLGLLLSRYGVELGIRELQTTLALEPDQMDALLQLGAAHAERGEFTEAHDALDAALQIDPYDPLANREKGILLLDQGKVHDAIKHLKFACEQLNEDLELSVDLSLAYVQAGFLEKGKTSLSRVVEKNPNHLLALYNLATISKQMDEIDETFRWLTLASQVDFFRTQQWLRDDPMFASLRQDERYEAIVMSNPIDN